jgi:hypothetical protein
VQGWYIAAWEPAVTNLYIKHGAAWGWCGLHTSDPDLASWCFSPRAPQQQDFHLRALRDVFKWTATDEEMESIQNAGNLEEPGMGRGWSTLS